MQRLRKEVETAKRALSSNPEADAEEVKEKQKEVEDVCAPIISKYYQAGGGGGGMGEEDDEEAHDEL